MTTQIDEKVESHLRNDSIYEKKVILYNDDFNSFFHVIDCVQNICKKSKKEAIKITTEAHETGKSLCFTGSMEACETVAEKMGEANLTVSIEE